MGIVRVACTAARAADVPASTMTSTFSATRSAASRGWRPRSPSAHRYSMWMFFPSSQPRSASPRRNAPTRGATVAGPALLITPIRYTFSAGWAAAASGTDRKLQVSISASTRNLMGALPSFGG